MPDDPEIVNKCLDEIDRLKARINMLECIIESYGGNEEDFKCYCMKDCPCKCEIKSRA
jgi:hypothetical protein